MPEREVVVVEAEHHQHVLAGYAPAPGSRRAGSSPSWSAHPSPPPDGPAGPASRSASTADGLANGDRTALDTPVLAGLDQC